MDPPPQARALQPRAHRPPLRVRADQHHRRAMGPRRCLTFLQELPDRLWHVAARIPDRKRRTLKRHSRSSARNREVARGWSRPKFPLMIRGHVCLPGISGVAGWVADYAIPWRWLTLSRSKARRWSGVGVVMSWKPGRVGSAGWIWLRQMVARSPSRVPKLWMGRSSPVRLAAALASARGERVAGATGLSRVAWAVALSSSVNSMGARRACMCQVM